MALLLALLRSRFAWWLLVLAWTLVLASPRPARAANTVTWNSASPGAWETASNWSPATVPGPGDDVVINTAAVTLSSTTTVHSLALGGGTLSIAAGNTLTASAGGNQTGGTLTGSGTLAVPSGGTFTWTSGTMSGSGTTSIASGGTLVISSWGCCSSNHIVLDQRTLANAGTVTLPASVYEGFTAQNGAAINNSGLFDIQADQPLLSSGTPPTFTNSGTVRKSAGTSYYGSALQIALVNTGTGTTSVSSGTLSLSSGSISSGQFIVSGSGVLDFSGGAHTWNAGTSFGNSSGTVRVRGGTLTVNGNVSLPPTTQQTGGTLTGSGTVTVPNGGTFTWTSGTMSGSGTTSIASGGTLVISSGGCCSSNHIILDQRTLANAGTVTLPATAYEGFTAQNGASINNTGLFDIQSDQPLLSSGTPPTFTNSGTLRKSAGTSYYGNTLQVHLINAGTVSLLSGALAVSMGYDQPATGSLNIQLSGSGCTTVPRIDVSGAVANLGGALNITTTGGCQPAPIQDFQIMTFPLSSGTFSSVSTPFIPTYGAAKLTVAVPPNIVTVAPVRVVDTRAAGGPIVSGTSRCFQMAGVLGIPSDVTAVLLNVTATGQTTNGWLTVYPDGQPVPATSTLNFGSSQYALANNTIMGVGNGGRVCVNVGTIGGAPGSTHVILDATGFLSSRALSQVAMLASPIRLIDTRTSGGQIASGQSRCFAVAGQSGIPGDAAAVVLNVTAVGYPVDGWLTVFPNGQSVPTTSTLNFDQSEYAMANGAVVRLGGNGSLCVNVGTANSAPGGSNVILDVTGYVTQTGINEMPMLTTPKRVADTRTSSGGPIATGTSRCFSITSAAGIPSNATGLVLNVTATGYSRQGWLTVYPAGQSVPSTSTLNFDVSEYAMANGTIIAIGAGNYGQQVCVQVGTVNSAPGSAGVIIDVVGYLLR